MPTQLTFKRTKMKFLDFINYHLQGFGFTDTTDLMTSTFHINKNWVSIGSISLFFGALALFIENYIGITPIVYLSFLILLSLEFLTGIKASLKAGKKIESRKFGRMIFKIGIYTLILGAVHALKGMGGIISIYYLIYYIIFNMVVIQLIISVFENLAKLGYTESNRIIKYLKNRLSKWFDIESPVDHDKQ